MTIMSKYLSGSQEYIRWLRKSLDLDTLASKMKNRIVNRGAVYYCHFGINIGSEQEEYRPCVVLQHRNGNIASPNTIVAPITHTKSTLGTVVQIAPQKDSNGKVVLDGYALLSNIVTVSKARLGDFITDLTKKEMDDIDAALAQSIDLAWKFDKLKRIIEDKDNHIVSLKRIIDEKDKEIARLLSLQQNLKPGSADSTSEE